MNYPQATVQFQGIDSNLIHGCEVNWSRGVTPSIALLRMSARPGGIPPARGDLQVLFGGTPVVTWANAAIDWAYCRVDQGEPGVVWSVPVLDRRWEWWSKVISGAYNVPQCNGQRTNEKSARELVGILLTALGESSYDISGVPSDVYPHVVWDESLVPAELASLCDKVNCVPHLIHSSDSVKVSRLGTGASLPLSSPDRRYEVFPVSSHARPQSLKVTTGPTIYQAAISLEAVGLDGDCVVKPIDEMAIKPGDGWEPEWPQFFSGVAKADRHLAFKSVYRWYRIKDFDGSLQIPGTSITLGSIEEILPVKPSLIDGNPFNSGQFSPGDKSICFPPLVRGYYWPHGDKGCTLQGSTAEHWDFSVDLENGIVIFSEPVFQIVSGCTSPAELELLAAFEVCREDGCVAEEFTRQIAGNGYGEKILRRPWMRRRVVVTPSCASNGASDNYAEIQTECNNYLNAFPSRWENQVGYDLSLNGIEAIELSGKIAQVKWGTGRMRLSYTRASMHKEFDVYDESYSRRRSVEKLRQLSHDLLRGE